jgi:hypothetical protein
MKEYDEVDQVVWDLNTKERVVYVKILATYPIRVVASNKEEARAKAEHIVDHTWLGDLPRPMALKFVEPVKGWKVRCRRINRKKENV